MFSFFNNEPEPSLELKRQIWKLKEVITTHQEGSELFINQYVNADKYDIRRRLLFLELAIDTTTELVSLLKQLLPLVQTANWKRDVKLTNRDIEVMERKVVLLTEFRSQLEDILQEAKNLQQAN